MNLPFYFRFLRGRVRVFFSQASKLNFFYQMVCIYLLKSRGGPQSFDFYITTYTYPLYTGWYSGLGFMYCQKGWDLCIVKS